MGITQIVTQITVIVRISILNSYRKKENLCHGYKTFIHSSETIKKGKKTYQANKKEKDKEGSAEYGLAVDVTVADSRHCDYEEVHTCPVGQLLGVVELHRVPRVLQLNTTLIVNLLIYRKYFSTSCCI